MALVTLIVVSGPTFLRPGVGVGEKPEAVRERVGSQRMAYLCASVFLGIKWDSSYPLRSKQGMITVESCARDPQVGETDSGALRNSPSRTAPITKTSGLFYFFKKPLGCGIICIN